MKRMSSVLKDALELVKPQKADISLLKNLVDPILSTIRSNIQKQNINAQVFVGGSFAKKTVVTSEEYDIDVFIRFHKKYPDEKLPEITTRILRGISEVRTVHGSRDYFSIAVQNNIFVEIIPVRKVSTIKDAKNITDLSYSHVTYITKKIVSDSVRDNILLAKAFCQAQECYGAESYIHGFSGYSLELLVTHYKSFSSFLKAMVKVEDKLIIDMEKLYKNKNHILLDLNSSKLASPVVLIDPTYKQRNALAALSRTTFTKFQKAAKIFLASPSTKAFQRKVVDFEKVARSLKNRKKDFLLVKAVTDRQIGDIAGSKLLKFFNHLEEEMKTHFTLSRKTFRYNKDTSAHYLFVGKPKAEIVKTGPFEEDKKNALRFTKEHKQVFVKRKRLYFREQVSLNLEEFFNRWKKHYQRRLKEMSIVEVSVVH